MLKQYSFPYFVNNLDKSQDRKHVVQLLHHKHQQIYIHADIDMFKNSMKNLFLFLKQGILSLLRMFLSTSASVQMS